VINLSDRTDDLLMARADKSSLTEIWDTTNDSIEEIIIKFKSGHTIVIKV